MSVDSAINRALVERIETLERELAAAHTGLDDALSVIDRLEKYLDEYLGGEGTFDWWCMGNDHQLYDDLLSLPAPTKEDA